MSLSLLLASAALLGGPPADTSFRLSRGASVEINTQNRDITVHVGSGDMLTVKGGGSTEVDRSNVSIDGDDHGGDKRHRGAAIGAGVLEITLPAWARVEINTVGGNLILDGTTTGLSAQTVNGSIRLTGGSGRVELGSVGGPITVTDFKGTDLSIDANNEPITVSNATGALHIDNVNGSIRLRGIRSSQVEVSTINGAVEFEGPLAADGRYDFESHNDNITLTLPGDVSARFKVSLFNGTFETDIPATTGGREVPAPPAGNKGKAKDKGDGERELTVTYGTGAARVTIDSFNGDVRVKRMTSRN